MPFSVDMNTRKKKEWLQADRGGDGHGERPVAANLLSLQTRSDKAESYPDGRLYAVRLDLELVASGEGPKGDGHGNRCEETGRSRDSTIAAGPSKGDEEILARPANGAPDG